MISNTNLHKIDKSLLEGFRTSIKTIFKESSSDSFENVVRPKRMSRPNIESVNLRASDKPIDYGHCNMLLVDKYGKTRGDESYEYLFVNANNNGGWTVCQNIQKEKIAMFRDLKHTWGEKAFTELFGFTERPDDLDDVNYFNLWQLWIKAAGKGGNIKRTKIQMSENTKKVELSLLEEEVVNITLSKDKENIERKIKMVGKLSNHIKDNKDRKYVIECLRSIKNRLTESEIKESAIQIVELKESTRLFLEKTSGEATIKLPDLEHIKRIKISVIENEEAPETIFVEFEVPFYPAGNSFLEMKDSLFDLNKRFARLGTNILNQTINWKQEKNPYFSGTGIWEGGVRLFDVKPGSVINGKGELALDTKVKENPVPFAAYKQPVLELLTNLDVLMTKWFAETSNEEQQFSLTQPKKNLRAPKNNEEEDTFYSDEKEFEGPSDEEIDKLAAEKAIGTKI